MASIRRICLSFAVRGAVIGALGTTACGPRAARPQTPASAHLTALPGDAPYELAEDQDLEEMRNRFDALPVDAPERAELRERLATEYARRVDVALDRGLDPQTGYEQFLLLASLWTPAELDDPAKARGLARFAPQAEHVRSYFARGGGDREATAALVLLAIMQPDEAAARVADIDEIFAYADSLAVAQYGPGAQRARPIEILESIVASIPSRMVVDRLVSLYQARQKAVESQFRRNGPDFAVIRAHGEGVLQTAQRITRALVLAGRIDEAPAAIAAVSGIGDSPKLRKQLTRVLHPAHPGEGMPTAADWIHLAQLYRDEDEDKDDPVTSLRIAEVGLTRMPDAAALQCYTGMLDDAVNNVFAAIDHFERCLALVPGEREAADRLAGLYEARIGTLVFADRPRAASQRLRALEKFHAEAEKLYKEPLRHDLAAAYATMGRGLVTLGELDEAERYLKASIERRPDFPALESLGTIALKRDQWDDAIRYFDKALRLPATDLTGKFQRAKILRLASEAYAGASNRLKARHYADSALAAWREVSSHGRLVAHYQGELKLEEGKLLWQLGRRDEALSAFDAAVDADPDGAETHAGVVSFLLFHDQPDRALDAYHRALGSFQIGPFFKVYMSLWMLVEARRRGENPDPLAVAYLAGRKGRLWYDQLAGYALGSRSLAPLEKRANTRARRAELLYYRAVLGEASRDPKQSHELLEQVVATDMVLFFEYDMAKQWLELDLRADTTSTR